jgi:hypothetical protein
VKPVLKYEVFSVATRLLKKAEMIGGWIKLHNEAFHNFYSSPNIIKMVKLTTVRCTGDVQMYAYEGEEECM